MDSNHDQKKAESLAQIRQSCQSLLRFTIIVLIIELISRHATALYTYLVQKQYSSGHEINMHAALANLLFGNIPEQIARAVLIITSVIGLIMMLQRIRKSESPFEERHGRLLQIIAILEAIIPFIPVIGQIVLRAKYEPLAYEDIFALFHPRIFSYLQFGNALLLFFLAWVIRYGACLQQESDETL